MDNIRDEYDDFAPAISDPYEEEVDGVWVIDKQRSEEEIANSKKFDERWGPVIDFDADRCEADEEDPFENFGKRNNEQADLKALEEKRMEEDGWIVIEHLRIYLVPDDIVRFSEFVWSDSFFDKRIIGDRTNTIRVTGRSCSKQGTLRIYFKVLESIGSLPLEKDRETWRAPNTILYQKDYGPKCYRKRWADESQREVAVAEWKQRESDLWDKIQEERKRKERECIKALAEGHTSLALVSDDSDCNDESDKDNDDEEIEQLSEEEQQWVDSEWYNDVPNRTFMGSRERKWELDKGWTPLFDTYDNAIVGDIIRFSDPIFTCRYPYGKYCGSSIVIAEVVKIGREYFHLKFLACRGEKPRCKSRGIFRRQFGTVYSNEAYRLKWQSEGSIMFEYQRQIGTKFSSFEDYVDYVRPDNTESDE